MGKIKIMGFHSPSLSFSLMTPIPQTTTPNFIRYTSKDA